MVKIAGKSYNLKYTYNNIADIEEKAKISFPELLGEKRIGFSTWRILIWGGLLSNSSKLTIEEVGDILGQEIKENGHDRLNEITKSIMTQIEKDGVLGNQQKVDEKK